MDSKTYQEIHGETAIKHFIMITQRPSSVYAYIGTFPGILSEEELERIKGETIVPRQSWSEKIGGGGPRFHQELKWGFPPKPCGTMQDRFMNYREFMFFGDWPKDEIHLVMRRYNQRDSFF